MSSHAKIRVAFELGFATCVGDAWSSIRDAIAAAVVGHKIHREPHLGVVWVSKEDGAEAMKKWKAAFDSYKETMLFPAEHGLAELHEYYRAFSEGGTHASVSSMGLPFQQRTDAEGMNFAHLYPEGDPKKLAPFLHSMLSACALIERACFECFKARLDLDPELGRMTLAGARRHHC
jgi:hypothetical protein